MKLFKSEIPYDKYLLLVTIILLVFGIIMVVSAGSFVAEVKFNNRNFFIDKQIKNVLVGLFALLVGMNLNYRIYKKKFLIYPALLLSLVLLIVLIATNSGNDAKGATRWLFGFMPSEVAKFALIFYFSYTIAEWRDRIKDFKRGYLVHLAILGLFVMLVFLQPAFSTSMMIFGISFIMFYLGGMKSYHLLSTFLLLVPVIAYMAMFDSYRMDRIESFLNPTTDTADKGWQVEQSLISFGNGGFSGVGLGESRQKELYLPEPHNDFIFSIVGDELGFLGTVSLVGLYLIFGYRGFKIARKSRDFYGYILGSGITLAVLVYATFNMAITLGLVPPTGLPLPFISYGGSSLVLTLFSVGVLLNISYKTNIENANA